MLTYDFTREISPSRIRIRPFNVASPQAECPCYSLSAEWARLENGLAHLPKDNHIFWKGFWRLYIVHPLGGNTAPMILPSSTTATFFDVDVKTTLFHYPLNLIP